MTYVEVRCFFCGKTYLKELRRFNEGKKFGWRFYCSLKCQSSAKNKRKTLKCGNSFCGKIFKRQSKEIPSSGICFCSRSCSAIVNNQKSPKRQPKTRVCFTCKKEFIGVRKYCSQKCIPKKARITKQQIIDLIQTFYKEHRRIPVKREFFHYKAARRCFGTWNYAIKTAGFEPNPVKFAKKHIAYDGHKCDSFAEFVIDNWLYRNNIPHKIHVPYPESNMTADFKVDGILIEFLGLKGELEKYDKLIVRKEKLWKEKGMKIVKIYPQDLFPKNNLDKMLRPFLK